MLSQLSGARTQCRLRAVGDLHLVEDARHVVLHGLQRQAKGPRDLGVGRAFRDQGEDLALPTGEVGELSVRRPMFGMLGVFAELERSLIGSASGQAFVGPRCDLGTDR